MKFIILLAICILNFVFLTSGCISNVNHFQNSEISFDYPSNWSTGIPTDMPGVIIAVSSENVKIMIFKERIQSGSSLKDIYNQELTNRSKTLDRYCYQSLAERTITVDGMAAYESVYRIGCNETQTRQQIRNVIFEKNGFLYTIYCNVIPPEDFDKENKNFDIIINSFEVK